MKKLSLANHGLFDVATASGASYLIDIDRRTVLRRPGGALPGVEEPHKPFYTNDQDLSLGRIDECRVGSRLDLLLSLPHDYNGYDNVSCLGSEVVSIEQVS